VFFKPGESFSKMLTSKSGSILKPYFVVMGCLGIMKLVAGHESAMSFAYDLLYATGSTVAWPPIWFLPYLFLTFAFTWLIVKLFSSRLGTPLRSGLVSASVLLLIGYLALKFQATMVNESGVLGKNEIPELPWSMDLLFIGSAYFILGHVLAEYVINFKPKSVWSLIAAFIFGSLHYFFDDTVDLNLRVYGNLLICTLQAISAIYIVLVLSKFLDTFEKIRRLFCYIGSGSLFILIFHWPVQRKLFDVLQSISDHQDTIAINGAVAFLCGIMVPLMIWEMTKRLHWMSAILLPKNSAPNK